MRNLFESRICQVFFHSKICLCNVDNYNFFLFSCVNSPRRDMLRSKNISAYLLRMPCHKTRETSGVHCLHKINWRRTASSVFLISNPKQHVFSFFLSLLYLEWWIFTSTHTVRVYSHKSNNNEIIIKCEQQLLCPRRLLLYSGSQSC